MLLAVFLFLSGTLLLYTAIISPAQIFLWDFKEEECNVFPTLYFDIVVDLFFLVSYMWVINSSKFLPMTVPLKTIGGDNPPVLYWLNGPL